MRLGASEHRLRVINGELPTIKGGVLPKVTVEKGTGKTEGKVTKEKPSTGGVSYARRDDPSKLKNPGDYCIAGRYLDGKMYYKVFYLDFDGNMQETDINNPHDFDGVDYYGG